jgi:hypothetical protein
VVIVAVPARGSEAAHDHADLRFLLATQTPAAITAESPDAPLRWLSLPQARELTAEDNLRDLFPRVARLLES